MTEAAVGCAPGDSAEQRAAEKIVVAEYARRIGVALAPCRLDLGGGLRVEVDAVDSEQTVLCEAWAHIGVPKGAQKHKVMTDAMKLLLAESHIGHPCRKVLLFADGEAAKRFLGQNWMAEALRRTGIDVQAVDLPGETRSVVAAAQTRQFR